MYLFVVSGAIRSVEWVARKKVQRARLVHSTFLPDKIASGGAVVAALFFAEYPKCRKIARDFP